MITTKKAKSKEAVITVDAKWGVNSRAVKDYEYITNPAQFYETHYNALKNYYLDSDMTTAEAHARASRNLTGPAGDGGLGYMVYTVPEGQEFIGANGKVNPQATLGTASRLSGRGVLRTARRLDRRRIPHVAAAGIQRQHRAARATKPRFTPRSATSTTKVSPTIRTWTASRAA